MSSGGGGFGTLPSPEITEKFDAKDGQGVGAHLRGSTPSIQAFVDARNSARATTRAEAQAKAQERLAQLQAEHDRKAEQKAQEAKYPMVHRRLSKSALHVQQFKSHRVPAGCFRVNSCSDVLCISCWALPGYLAIEQHRYILPTVIRPHDGDDRPLSKPTCEPLPQTAQ